MSTQTELETLIVRLRFDAAQAMQELNDAVAEYRKASQELENNSNRGERAQKNLSLSMRDTRHALHLLAATSGIGGAGVHEAMMAYYAWHLLHKMIHSVGEVLGTLKGGAIGLGVAALIAGAVALYQVWEKVSESAKKLEEHIKEISKGFASMSIPDALSEGRLAVAKKDFTEILEKMAEIEKVRLNPHAGKGFLNTIFGTSPVVLDRELDEMIGEMVNRAEQARAAVERISKDPRVRDRSFLVQLGQTTAEINKETQALRAEAMLAGRSADEQKAYAKAAELAAKSGMSLEGAILHTNAAQLLAEVRAKSVRDAARETWIEQQKGIQSIENHAAALEDEAATVGMAANAAERFLEIRKRARDESISEAEAESLYGEALDRVSEAKAKQARSRVTKEGLDLADKARANAVALMEGADAGERYAKALKLAEESGMSLKDALAHVTKEMKASQDVLSAQKVWEETRTPMEKYAQRMYELNNLNEAGVLDQELYDRAVQKAQKDILDAGAAAQSVQQVLFGSASFFKKLEEQQDKTTKPLAISVTGSRGSAPPAVAAATAAGLAKQDKQIDLLKQINANLKPQLSLPPPTITIQGANLR